MAAEAAERFDAQADVVGHREVEWTSADVVGAVSMRTADDVFLVGQDVHGIGRSRVDLRRLSTIDAEPIREVLAARTPARGGGNASLAVTASFLGARNFSRFDVEDIVGSTLSRILGMRYAPRRLGPPPPDSLHWRVHIARSRARLGLRIADAPLHRRRYKLSAPKGTTHPPVAAAMARLANVHAGELLWDPTCGAGTIPIEAKLLHPDVLVGGSDVDPARVSQAADNAAAAGIHGAFVMADAVHLPIRHSSVRAIVANLPWGRQTTNLGQFAGGSTPLLRACAAHLVDGASIVLLSDERRVATQDTFDLTSTLPLSLMGAHPLLRVWHIQ